MRIFILFALLGLTAALQAQVHCDGTRYVDYVFDDIDSTTGVIYGSNLTAAGSSKTLRMDIYYPAQEFFFKRPVVILAHGGSFIFGNRTQMRPFCIDLAQRGFVAITIDYRLFDAFAQPIDSVTVLNMVIDAVSDMKAAVRSVKEEAANGNNFGVDTNEIYLGGISAGAVTALHAAYLDEGDYNAGSMIDSIIAQNGGIRGNSSSNYQYSDTIRGVMNYSGALKTASWIDEDEVPVFSVHDDGDTIVPYGRALMTTLGPSILVEGSERVHEEALKDGLKSQLITIENSDGHVSYFLNGVTADYQRVVDSSAIFLESCICAPPLGLKTEETTPLELYPQPARDIVYINGVNSIQAAFVFDQLGKKASLPFFGRNIDVSSLNTGFYVLVAIDMDGTPLRSSLVIGQ